MINQDDSNRPYQLPKQRFIGLLAAYRARVYENHFLASINPTDATRQLTHYPESTILVVEDTPDQWFLTRWALLKRFP